MHVQILGYGMHIDEDGDLKIEDTGSMYKVTLVQTDQPLVTATIKKQVPYLTVRKNGVSVSTKDSLDDPLPRLIRLLDTVKTKLDLTNTSEEEALSYVMTVIKAVFYNS